MTTPNMAVGARGEQLAAEFLAAQGMAVLDRNWRCADGELDIIARDGGDIVFVEVKTRRSARFGLPQEAVHRAKQRKLRQLAARWLAVSGIRPHEVRFDVVAVEGQDDEPQEQWRIEHLRGAF